MSKPVAHCPFLNRSDHRCVEFFSLDRLGHAYKYCFDGYRTCPVYADLLSERQERRAAPLVRMNHGNLVQITLAARNARTADPAVPVASGL